MKLSENKYKYAADVKAYVNGIPINECSLLPPLGGGDGFLRLRKGDVQTFRVSKKVDGKFIGLSKLFKTHEEAWDYLEQFEEGKI